MGPGNGRIGRWGAFALLLGVAACESHEFKPPDRAQQVAQASSSYTPALFDTIQWPNANSRLAAGNEIYARKCDKCHGPFGQAGTDYARERTLDVPSLVTPEWSLAGDRDGVRKRIFTGHSSGMPTWGIADLTPREVDAVTAYVLEQLRPDALKRR